MLLTDFQKLDYLHDAKCLEIAWDCTSPSGRILRLLAVADSEAGFSLWEGKELIITLSDVVATRFMSWGFQTGQETIDAWRQGVSDSLERECQSLRASGISVPSLRFSISFHSGSCLEVVCSEVSVVEMR
jgi:hypothetical protein